MEKGISFHANRNDKKAGATIFLADKTDFKTKAKDFPGGPMCKTLCQCREPRFDPWSGN